MKKETKSYILNIIKSDYFIIDLVNMIVGIAVLAFAVIAFINGSMSSFGLVFILGALMSLINLAKSLMRKSYMGIFVFVGLTGAMFAMIFVIYGYFL